MACRLGPVLRSQVHFLGGFLRVGCLEEYLCRRNDNLMWLPSPDLSSQIRDFSIDTIPRDPPQFAIYFRSGSCFEHSAAQLNMDQSIDTLRRRLYLRYSLAVSPNVYTVFPPRLSVRIYLSSDDC